MAFKYEYVKVRNSFNGIGLFNGNLYDMDVDYQEIINKRALDGWRYVGFIPTVQRGTGHIQEMDLVFEKEEKTTK